ncbi:MAG: Sjogren's syndrome/scleroderma autoantigen 1 family protein [Haloferacaceae archaeon]
MSGFDKEAERERLREKYEKDQEKREATERMSELLLQGATMTNRHCDQCGDPIFRYEGQEFCPTCQTTKGGDGEDAAAETSQQAETAQQPETPRQAERASETRANGRPGDSAAGAESMATEPSQSGGESAVTSEPERGRTAESAPEPTQPPTPQRPSREGEASLERARGSLVRTLTRFAEAAETADDPRRAKELLGAAREAAATLDALER